MEMTLSFWPGEKLKALFVNNYRVAKLLLTTVLPNDGFQTIILMLNLSLCIYSYLQFQ